MKSSSKSPRTPSSLSDSIHHQLNAYALAASAAGVGVLALAQPAEPKIIYTPAHVIIGHGGVGGYAINFSRTTSGDFWLNTSNTLGTWWSGGLFANAVRRNGSGGGVEVRYSGSGIPFASALRPKVTIGPRRQFHSGGVMLSIVSSSTRSVWGDWNNVKDRYLGFKFKIQGKGKIHYGWARLNVRDHTHYITATLTGYAYETIPNKPIITGRTKGRDVITLEPGSLGHLAHGADWRMKQTAATQ